MVPPGHPHPGHNGQWNVAAVVDCQCGRGQGVIVSGGSCARAGLRKRGRARRAGRARPVYRQIGGRRLGEIGNAQPSGFTCAGRRLGVVNIFRMVARGGEGKIGFVQAY